MPNLEELKRTLQSRILYRNASLNTASKNIEERASSDVVSDDTSFILISNHNETERFDWWEGETYIEELDVKGADYSQLKTFFKDHQPSVDNAIGRVENLRVENGELVCRVVFGSDEQSQTIKQKYDDQILTDVSIGYRVNEIIETSKKDEPNHVLVTDYTIVELSAVWKGADAGAVKIKSNAAVKPTEQRFSFDIYEKKNKLRKGI